MDGLTEGRIVHFVMPDGEHRPAIIVKVWNQDPGTCNLVVFVDGSNDGQKPDGSWSLVQWQTSVVPDPLGLNGKPKVGTWHWIEPA